MPCSLKWPLPATHIPRVSVSSSGMRRCGGGGVYISTCQVFTVYLTGKSTTRLLTSCTVKTEALCYGCYQILWLNLSDFTRHRDGIKEMKYGQSRGLGAATLGAALVTWGLQRGEWWSGKWRLESPKALGRFIREVKWSSEQIRFPLRRRRVVRFLLKTSFKNKKIHTM